MDPVGPRTTLNVLPPLAKQTFTGSAKYSRLGDGPAS